MRPVQGHEPDHLVVASVSAATETDTVVDVDLDATVPCGAPDCPTPAVWVIHPPCGHPVLSCEPHRKVCDRRAEHDKPWCVVCHGDVATPLDWRPL